MLRYWRTMNLKDSCASPAAKKPAIKTRPEVFPFWHAGFTSFFFRSRSLEQPDRTVETNVHLAVVLSVVVILCSGCNDATHKTAKADPAQVTETAPAEPRIALVTHAADERPPKSEIDRA